MQISRYSGIKKIQRGVAAMTAAKTLDITVSAVDMSKSAISLCGQHYSAAGGNDALIYDNACSVNLLNGSAVRVEKAGGGTFARVSWELIEYA
jgi:hypothetical protein